MSSIAVITRTKNRHSLLARALDSIVGQKHQDLVWIVVDDGVPSAEVDAIIERARGLLREVVLRRTSGDAGMENASNIGIASAQTDLVTFLDDDDTWEPSFLSETIAFLAVNPQFAGVCTQTSQVLETAEDLPQTIQKFTMNADLMAISLADFMLFNHFTTNSLVYRRSVHASLGGYREDMPVMGDWDFGIRLVAVHDVGVIPKPLANYHRRADVKDPNDPRANTVVAAQDVHAIVDAKFRNEWLRRDLDTGRFGIGAMLSLGRMRLRADSLLRFRFDEVRIPLEQRIAELDRKVAAVVDSSPSIEHSKDSTQMGVDVRTSCKDDVLTRLDALEAKLELLVRGQEQLTSQLKTRAASRWFQGFRRS